MVFKNLISWGNGQPNQPQSGGNHNQWSSCFWLCSVQFQFFFWSTELDLQTLISSPCLLYPSVPYFGIQLVVSILICLKWSGQTLMGNTSHKGRYFNLAEEFIAFWMYLLLQVELSFHDWKTDIDTVTIFQLYRSEKGYDLVVFLFLFLLYRTFFSLPYQKTSPSCHV